jgi:hypothetical protein
MTSEQTGNTDQSEFEVRLIGVRSSKFMDLSTYSAISEYDKVQLLRLQSKLPKDCYAFVRNMEGRDPATFLSLLFVIGPSHTTSAEIEKMRKKIAPLALKLIKAMRVFCMVSDIISAHDFSNFYIAERWTADDTATIPIYYRLK